MFWKNILPKFIFVMINVFGVLAKIRVAIPKIKMVFYSPDAAIVWALKPVVKQV